jgi:hypothetical protein
MSEISSRFSKRTFFQACVVKAFVSFDVRSLNHSQIFVLNFVCEQQVVSNTRIQV